MQVDFYQLTRDPAEKILPAIAGKVLANGGRLLVVSSDAAQLASLSSALWGYKPESFLANGVADGSDDDALQPVLLSHETEPANRARLIALADGQWRGAALEFDRAFYLFAPSHTDDARAAWRMLGEHDTVKRNYWRQDGGRWVQGP